MAHPPDPPDPPPAPTAFSHKLAVHQRLAPHLDGYVLAADPLAAETARAALLGAGADLLPLLVRRLDTFDPQTIRRLGELAAAYPDRAATVAALRRAALDPRQPDLRRMATMLVLQQFLDQPLDDSYFAGLRDPTGVAVDSLLDVLTRAEADRNLLLAYLGALQAQPPAVLAQLVARATALGPQSRVALLQLIALHDDPALHTGAGEALAALRTPGALLALRMLNSVAPPDQRSGIERALLKLRLSGVALPRFAAVPPGARALQTEPDAAGRVALWFLLPQSAGLSDLLSLYLHPVHGITDAFGSEGFAAASLPPPAPPGTRHRGLTATHNQGPRWSVPFWDAPGADFMEISFAEGRRLVARYQLLNWGSGTALPWEYRLLHDLIWRFGPPLP